MAEDPVETAHLRKLAAKCVRVASNLTDQIDVAALQQMAVEYEALANRLERTPMPNPQPPIGQ